MKKSGLYCDYGNEIGFNGMVLYLVWELYERGDSNECAS